MISEQVLEQLAGQIIQTPPELRYQEVLQPVFKALVTQGSLTVCSDNDIPGLAKPVFEGEDFDLYLVDASSHCAGLTNNHDIACGVVLALHDDDD
ncbi:DUF6129 family protein [Oceanospirillum sediminis]|uniref:DUF6129 domain-containing protein n=1 Tax=Oceanospirillum sediminis TaxID=2760088 RepID=A0A839IP74_9GAMM|nr:DUF6129 family protein [Oceanospirillum sediminis]MBB1486474.1 hypothetical protein [Oceanospirillum sediminis]